jgi:hypothetical protein
VEELYKTIYYGNYEEVKFPPIHKENYTRDFSWGCYFTDVEEQAWERARKFITPVINVYRLKNVDKLNIKNFEDYSDEWLEFVVHCRNGGTHDYDVVIGAMADDTICDYIDGYMAGRMNKELFFELMRSKHPTHQISFHTIRGLDCIEFIRSYQIAIPKKKLSQREMILQRLENRK